MKHLDDADDADLKAQVEDTTPDDEGAEKAGADKRTEREYPFHFEFTDDRGKKWEGAFVNRILSIADRGRAGVLEASLNNGLPHDSIPNLIRTAHHAIAHMTFSLDERPEWAKNLRKLTDLEIIFALFQEVAEHERVFHGRQSAEGES